MAMRRYGPYSFEASNEGKVLFDDLQMTKGDLIEYYEKIAEYLLPHIRGRPITMQRFPDGIDAGGFYEKKLPGHFPDWVGRVGIRTSEGSQDQVVCNNKATLAYLANQACITPHAWLSTQDALDKPDQMIFDLDPPPDQGFDVVRQAAMRVRSLLDELDITALLKTTGSRGVHLVIPLQPRHGFDAVRATARDLADHLAARHDDTLTTEARKNKRQGRLYLDTARNAYGQTVVCPYAIRAREGAPVAVPITWDELASGDIEAQSVRADNVFRRLGQTGDLWRDFHRHRRSLNTIRDAVEELM